MRRAKEVDMTDQERMTELEAKIADLQTRLPKHSVRAAMLIELEDMEDELAELRVKTSQGGSDGS
jgi:hypothetical protein